MKGRDYKNLIFSILFFALIALPCLTLTLGIRIGPNTNEKRILKPLPEIQYPWETFKKDFEEYFQDHYGLKNLLVISNSALRYFALGSSSSAEVLVGTGPNLFYKQKNTLRDFKNRNLFSERELKKWKKALESRAEYSKSKGAIYLFVIAPDSKSIYPERLPDWLVPEKNEDRIDQLFNYLEQNTEVQFLDLRPELNKAKKQKEVYYHTDSHWNDEGAFIVYTEIIRKLNSLNENRRISNITHNDFFIQPSSVSGDLTLLLGLDSLITETTNKLIFKTPWNSYIIKNGPDGGETLTTENTKKKGEPSIVFFHDSFGEPILPWLAESFSKTNSLNTNGFNRQLVKDSKPNFVIQIMVERKLFYYEPNRFQ